MYHPPPPRIPIRARLVGALLRPFTALVLLGAAGVTAASVAVVVTSHPSPSPTAVSRLRPVSSPTPTPAPPPEEPATAAPVDQTPVPPPAPSPSTAPPDPFRALCSAITGIAPPETSRRACERLAEAAGAYARADGRAERHALHDLRDKLGDDDEHSGGRALMSWLSALNALPQAPGGPA